MKGCVFNRGKTYSIIIETGRDINIQKWIYKVHQILYDAFWGREPSIEEIRKKYLSEDEIREINKEIDRF
jgi:hypothetical protein